ncbi:unnamed protein product [Cylicostephanus goldi]|uniref:Glycosyl transferase family 1 domain-containing protein n=1 Tax=Cylicostephanus goldi TaxID=71465 RepID=A0A3P6S3X7_CYLGO|nr:unnamed protein product [Cylicostephanus goldi]
MRDITCSFVKVELTIAGGCRNAEDQNRVQKLKGLAKAWDLTENVKWKLNVAYEELLDALSESMISIHTMWNEHFGIVVVEGMAAGTIMLAHDSGGPELDILRPADLNKQEQPLGFLASTKDGWWNKMFIIFSSLSISNFSFRD